MNDRNRDGIHDHLQVPQVPVVVANNRAGRRVNRGRNVHHGDGHGYGVVVYQHTDFRGRAITLPGPGRYDLDDLRRLGVSNDDISSIRVPPRTKVKCFKHDHFRGRKLVFTGNVRNLCNHGLNDDISSIVVKAI